MKRLHNAIRVVIKAVKTGKIQLIDVKGRDEDFTNKELFQHYGFASKPLSESEGILLFIGGTDNAIVIATEDRRYRLALENGEAAMYSDEGDFIHFKRGKEIYIKSGNKVIVDAATLVNLKSGGTIMQEASSLIDMKVGGATKGVVQGDCICHFTGLPHGDISSVVKASK